MISSGSFVTVAEVVRFGRLLRVGPGGGLGSGIILARVATVDECLLLPSGIELVDTRSRVDLVLDLESDSCFALNSAAIFPSTLYQ